MKKIINMTGCLLLILAGIVTAHAYAILSAGGFTPYPTQVVCHQGFASSVKSAVSNACSAWNNAGVGTLVTRSSSTHSNQSDFPLKNNANQITTISYGQTLDVMCSKLTQVKVIGFKRYNTEVDININTSYPWATNGDSKAYDVQNGITHELGHLLGLDEERNKTGSTMYFQLRLGETLKRTLDSDDIEGLKLIY